MVTVDRCTNHAASLHVCMKHVALEAMDQSIDKQTPGYQA